MVGYTEDHTWAAGGLRLARPAASIQIGDVVNRTEPDMAIAPLLSEAASESFLRTLDAHSRSG
jgi:DNA-binding IscR family transcriptional regulator